MKHNGWLTLAQQYLKTSKLIMEQIKVHKNKWFMIDDKPIEWNDYLESTKWSDFNTFVPALFLMQHGLELMIKGLYTFTGNNITKTHNLMDLLNGLRESGIIDHGFASLLNNYIGEEPKNKMLQEFKKLNQHLDSNLLHVNLRYPDDRGIEINFSPFRYKENELIPKIKVLINDIEIMFTKSINIARKLEQKDIK